MAEINYNGNIIVLSSEYVGTATPWGEKYIKQHHEVRVDIGGSYTSFDYYCNDGGLNDDSEIEAFYCFLSDALAYNNARDIDDFASEFGYDKVSDLLKAYNGCKDAWDNWQAICGDIDGYELVNWLQETYNL